MTYQYLINQWALIRRDQMPVIPEKIIIHPDFLKELSKEEFETAFRFIWDMLYKIMTDISENPEHFGMPLIDGSIHFTSAKALESKNAAFRPIYLLNLLFRNGTVLNGSLYVDVSEFKKENKIKNLHTYFTALSEYGFLFEGLKNNKITPSVNELIVSFPDDPKIITVFSLVVTKAKNVGHDGDFIREWNFRLLIDGFHEFNYANPYQVMYDKMHDLKDKIFVETFHKAMVEAGYIYDPYGSGTNPEGPHIAYFINSTKGTYLFAMWSMFGDLHVYLRIRNAEKCFQYLENCPDRIKDVFRDYQTGCGFKECKVALHYVYEGIERRKCCCCGPAFDFKANIEDIPHYIRLVELGEKK